MAEQTSTSSASEERPTSEIMKENLGNFKKFASVSFSRAKQVGDIALLSLFCLTSFPTLRRTVYNRKNG